MEPIPFPAYFPQPSHGSQRLSPSPPSAKHTSATAPNPTPGASNASSIDEPETTSRNPLVDLIDTENLYLEQLGLIIRRVAAAWSKKDLPPPKLDTMFRSIETVYRTNRVFGHNLKELGPNPLNPKSLGDLLMKWVDDLEKPYHKYAISFVTGFNTYPPIANNALLADILRELSSSSTLTPPQQGWTLDGLFKLPYSRLHYYRNLYRRLLRSTKEGRSDHGLLLAANEKIDGLITEVEGRLDTDISDQGNRVVSVYTSGSGVVRAPSSTYSETAVGPQPRNDQKDPGLVRAPSGSRTSAPAPPVSRPSLNNVSPRPPSTPTSLLEDLEIKIDTEQTIDLFTMQAKKCKLQMSPRSLPYPRTILSSHDVMIHFTPTATNRGIIHKRSHIFILSDLFILAEWMEADDKVAKMQRIAAEQPERIGKGGPMPEMWLRYPPLAGKHLVITEADQPNVLDLTVMGKETFVIHTESEFVKNQILHDMLKCINFASSHTTPSSSSKDSKLVPESKPEALRLMIPLPSPFSHAPSPTTISPNNPVLPPLPLKPGTLSFPKSPADVTLPNAPPKAAGSPLYFPKSPADLKPPPRPVDRSRSVSPQSLQAAPVQQGPQTSRPGVVPHQSLPPRGASLRSTPELPQGGLGPYQPQPQPQMQPQSLSQSQTLSHPQPQSYQTLPTGHRNSPVFPQAPQFPSSHVSMGRAPDSLGALHPAYPSQVGYPLSAGLGGISSDGFRSRTTSDDFSPPTSPADDEMTTLAGPTIISAQMKCKVFLKQSHQQWKSLGSAKLKLYSQTQGVTKQLVVESNSSAKTMLISTIVLTDGVERVAKTGVAVEISNRGKRTGIVYMIQLRDERSAMGLYESLLAGSDRAVGR